MEYKISSIDFSGPLDLLLELVKANKCDIKDIFINDIISQYFEFVQSAAEKETELASEFIVMASSLIEIKSRYFIYINDRLEEDSDPTTDLFNLLEEYKKYKEIAAVLGTMYEETGVAYSNLGSEVYVEETLDLSGFGMEDIFLSFSKFVKEEKEKRSSVISYKKISVETKIMEIEDILNKMSKVYFDRIINGKIRDDVVASLLGVLELSKEQRVSLSQQKIFENILIERLNYVD